MPPPQLELEMLGYMDEISKICLGMCKKRGSLTSSCVDPLLEILGYMDEISIMGDSNLVKNFGRASSYPPSLFYFTSLIFKA